MAYIVTLLEIGCSRNRSSLLFCPYMHRKNLNSTESELFGLRPCSRNFYELWVWCQRRYMLFLGLLFSLIIRFRKLKH